MVSQPFAQKASMKPRAESRTLKSQPLRIEISTPPERGWSQKEAIAIGKAMREAWEVGLTLANFPKSLMAHRFGGLLVMAWQSGREIAKHKNDIRWPDQGAKYRTSNRMAERRQFYYRLDVVINSLEGGNIPSAINSLVDIATGLWNPAGGDARNQRTVNRRDTDKDGKRKATPDQIRLAAECAKKELGDAPPQQRKQRTLAILEEKRLTTSSRSLSRYVPEKRGRPRKFDSKSLTRPEK